MGGIRTAIDLASLLDIDLKTIAFAIICHLSIPMQLKMKLVNNGIMRIMAICVLPVLTMKIYFIRVLYL